MQCINIFHIHEEFVVYFSIFNLNKKTGGNPLLSAVYTNSADIVNLLLEYGADVKSRDPVNIISFT